MQEKKQFLVDSALLVGLRPLFLGMAVVVLGAAGFRAAYTSLSIGLVTLSIGLVIAGIFLTVRHLMSRDRISARWAHPLAAMLTTIGYMFVLYNLVFRQEALPALRFIGLTLLIVMAGGLFLHLRWLMGMVALIFISWTALNLTIGLSIPWTAYLILFPIIAVASFAIYGGRKQAIARMIDAQMENDLRNAQLEEALERAHRFEAQLKAERDLADQVVDSMGQGLVLLDDRGVIEFVNPAARQILGQSQDALVGQMVVDVLASEDDGLRERIAAGSDFDLEDPVEAFIDLGNGKVSHLLASVTFRESGGIILNLTDLTVRKEFESRLEHLAHYDALTGLANRSLLNERVQQALLRIEERRPSQVAVLFLDLDRFKPINDSAGHAVGDLVLIQIANRIQECVRTQDTVARVGGDEFVILLADVVDNALALEIADRIARRIEEPILVDGHSHRVTASIGLAISQSPDARPDDLVHFADTAMYQAKRRNDVRRVLYMPGMKAHSPQLAS